MRNKPDWLIKLIVTISPTYWIMNHGYSKEYDEYFEKLLLTSDFKDIRPFYAKLGNEDFWIQNYPYACFTKYIHGVDIVRPSKFNIYKANEKLINTIGMPLAGHIVKNALIKYY